MKGIKPIRTVPLVFGVVTLAGVAIGESLWGAPVHAATLQSSSLGTLGYISSSYGNIVGSDKFSISLPTGETLPAGASVPPAGKYLAASENLSLHEIQIDTDKGILPVKIVLYDEMKQNYKNGWWLISTSDVPAFVKAFNGNLNFVEKQIANEKVVVTNLYTGQSMTAVNMAYVASESGASFSPETFTTSGNKIVVTANLADSGYPEASSIAASNGSTGSSTVTQGDPIKFVASSNVPLFSELSGGSTGHHFDAVELTNQNTGQSYWAVGTASDGIAAMQSVSGGTGAFSDSSLPEFNTGSLQAGTYMAELWVGDAVDRISSTLVTTMFTVTAGTPTTGAAPTITLSANPSSTSSGSSSLISYSVSNWSNGDYVTVSGAGGTDMWSETQDTKTTDPYRETEKPQGGQKTTVTYTATVYSPSGIALSTATTNATWTSSIPTVNLVATPVTLMSGRFTQLTATAHNMPSGDYIEIINMTKNKIVAKGQQDQSTLTAYWVENPVGGATQKDYFTARIINPN